MSVIIAILLSLVSGVGKGICDTLQFHYERSVFTRWNEQYWNPKVSWRNKYNAKNRWLRLLMSTWLVMFTDAWHLFQFVSYFSLFVLIALAAVFSIDMYWFSQTNDIYNVMLLAIVLYLIRTAGFSFTYNVCSQR